MNPLATPIAGFMSAHMRRQVQMVEEARRQASKAAEAALGDELLGLLADWDDAMKTYGASLATIADKADKLTSNG